ncbi:MAG: hypothetical protein ABW192_04380, partial [Sphingobium sp.]
AITTGAVTATGSAQLTSPGSVSLGSFAAQGNRIHTGGAALTVTGATSAAPLTFTSGGAAKLGSVTVTGALNGSGSSITAGAISAGLQLNLVSPGAISVGPLTGLGDIAVNGGGDIQLGTVTAGDSIFVRAGGAATLLNGSAGLVNPTTVQGGLTREIRVEANGNIVAGTLAAARDVALISNNGAIVGGAVAGVPSSITSGEDVLLLARTGASLGSISNTGGRVLIANSAMATFGTATNSDPIFTSTTPIAMTGAAAISGPVTTGALTVLAQNGISVAGVTASQRTVLAAANGPLALSGNVLSPQIQFISNDISIGGQINAGRAGNITIFSTNATGMRVGNATTGGGYVLDNSEFIRINSGFLTVGGIDSQSAAIDMTIGDLSMTGPLSGSTIDASNGIVRFFTGNPQTGQNSGVIRVTGSVRGFGFLPTNGVEFSTGRFEMDAETGLIEIMGANQRLDGTLYFDAPRIHVASATILDRLAADPLYAGRVTDLNTPLATPRPDGVIRAFDIDLGEADAVLVQNTGTADLPAGFLTFSQSVLDRDTTPALGSVDLILNGQLLSATGATVTGKPVLDILVNDTIRPFFTAQSSINGCLVSLANCIIAAPVEDEVQPFLQADNLLAIRNDGPSTEPQTDDDKRDEAEEAVSKTPIPPPPPIINTRPLEPRVDIDEPVAGAGNPALIGGGSADTAIGRGKL